jgi:hypothetical protein
MINKIVPQYLNKSDDEKLVKQVEMTNAENIRISADDDGDAGIVKTIKGNSNIRAKAGADQFVVEQGIYSVVGQVAIPKKQEVIYFVRAKTPNTNGGVDSIYRYNVESANYELLFRSSVLNFQADTLIEADVTFNDQDETLVYFTDGHNPPRKINIDRVIANKSDIWSDSDGANYYTDDERKEFLEVCKSPPLVPITFNYSTDSDYKQNNVDKKSFQFAYQYIYKDGEVSAISTYSKLAINPNTYGEGIVNSNFVIFNNKITLTFTSGDSEVEKVRILARQGGSVTFYKLGEVDNPSTSTGTFVFRNDGSYPAVSNLQVDKIYDNVPLKAHAQSISGNRLMYGDYIEGFDNISVDVESSVVYRDVEDPGVITASIENPSSGGPVHILLDGTSMESSYDAGAVIAIRVVLTSSAGGSIRVRKNSSGYLFTDDFVNSNINFDFGIGKYNDANYPIDVPFASKSITLDASILLGSTMTKDEILDDLASQFESTDDITYSHTESIVGRDAVITAVTTDTSPSSIEVGDAIEIGLDFPSVVIEFDEDTSYSVSGKRKIDLDITTLQAKVSVDAQSRRVIQYNGGNASGYDTRTPQAQSIAVANIYHVSKTGFTLPTTFNYAYEAGVTSFKSSAIHNFGIVYYDEKGRSSFVQKIDGVYVAGYGETARGSNKGAVQVNLKIKHNPPSWAKKYQVVYGGNQTYSDFIQYSVAGAHYKGNLIYLDLFPLEGKDKSYNKEKKSDLEYTFKEGDVLRVISYYDSSQNRQYVDGYTFGVIRKEVVTTDTDVSPNRASTFVVIRDEDYGTKSLDDFNLDDVKTGNDIWGQRVIVEIVSPKTVENDTVYYEIGESYDITSGAHVGDSTDGGYPVVELIQGDVYFKPREILLAPYDSANSEYDEDNYANFEYDTLYVESDSYSDFLDSDYTSKGRPHAILEDAREVRRRSSITYSDPYVMDSSVLTLSSFNPSTANFMDYDVRHGKIDKLIDQTDRLYIFQEHKVGFAPINRNLLQTLSDNNVVVSNNVLGSASYYAGNFGSSGYPGGIVERFGIMYYVDVKAQKVIRISRDGITPISDKSMDAFFDKELSSYLAQTGKTEYDIVAGYDPDNDEYILTIKSRGSFTSFTIAYDHKRGVWTSFYSFKPDLYANINDKFLSFNGGGTSGAYQEVLWEHGTNSSYGNFYGTNFPAKFSVVANIDPSSVKSYDAISLEGNKSWSATLSTTDQQTTIATADYDEREREFVAFVPRDTQNSTANYIVVGTVDSVDSANTGVTFKNRINTQPLPIGADLYYDNSGTLTSLSQTLSSVDSSKKLTASGNVSALSEDDVVVLKLTAKDEGDQLRDNFCKMDFESDHYSSKVELFAVNMHFNNESLHSSLGRPSVAKK